MADVQRYFRGEYGMVADGPEYPSREGDVFWIAEADYLGLQQRFAEVAAALSLANGTMGVWADRAQASEVELARLQNKIAGLVRDFDQLADDAHAEPAFPSEARVTMAAAYRGCAHRLADECLATPPTNTGGGA